jgi:hypothetical protein
MQGPEVFVKALDDYFLKYPVTMDKLTLTKGCSR